MTLRSIFSSKTKHPSKPCWNRSVFTALDHIRLITVPVSVSSRRSDSSTAIMLLTVISSFVDVLLKCAILMWKSLRCFSETSFIVVAMWCATCGRQEKYATELHARTNSPNDGQMHQVNCCSSYIQSECTHIHCDHCRCEGARWYTCERSAHSRRR